MTRARVAVPALVALLGACIPVVSDAQFPEAVKAGARIRVWVPEPYLQEQGPWRRQQLRGTVASVAPDTLRLSLPGTDGTLAVARQSIRRLDISRGRPSRVASAVERAFAGAIIGAIIGAITVALDNDPSGSEWPHYSRDWRAAEEGAKWGAAIGAAVGFILPTERWRRVRLRR